MSEASRFVIRSALSLCSSRPRVFRSSPLLTFGDHSSPLLTFGNHSSTSFSVCVDALRFLFRAVPSSLAKRDCCSRSVVVRTIRAAAFVKATTLSPLARALHVHNVPLAHSERDGQGVWVASVPSSLLKSFAKAKALEAKRRHSMYLLLRSSHGSSPLGPSHLQGHVNCTAGLDDLVFAELRVVQDLPPVREMQ